MEANSLEVPLSFPSMDVERQHMKKSGGFIMNKLAFIFCKLNIHDYNVAVLANPTEGRELDSKGIIKCECASCGKIRYELFGKDYTD